MNGNIIRYQVLSPDGFPIARDTDYESHKDAVRALDEFVKRYERQGYYSTSNRQRISLNAISSYCKIIQVKDEDEEDED